MEVFDDWDHYTLGDVDDWEFGYDVEGDEENCRGYPYVIFASRYCQWPRAAAGPPPGRV
jgi:hypothetical protein